MIVRSNHQPFQLEGEFPSAHARETTKHIAASLATAAELLHHLLGLFKLLDKAVDYCDIHTCTFCNAVLSSGI